jgi:hypothetical protein
MSRYEFTTREGFHVCTVEARTALEARDMAVSRSGRTDILCTHLSDDHTGEGIDPIFFYGPDAVDA